MAERKGGAVLISISDLPVYASPPSGRRRLAASVSRAGSTVSEVHCMGEGVPAERKSSEERCTSKSRLPVRLPGPAG